MSDAARIKSEQDPERLRTIALLLAQENERLIAKVLELQKRVAVAEGTDKRQLEIELASLQKELERRTERVLGHRSEKRGGKGEGGSEKKEPRRGHGPREQEQLRIIEVVHKLDEADMCCPCCGKRLEEIPGETEDSDDVDEIRREFVIHRHKRQKYRCPGGDHMTTAYGPKRWFKGGRYGLAFAIGVAVGKYLDHLPLERQVRQMARAGLEVDSQTLFDQCFALAEHLKPAYLRLAALQRQQHVLFADETRWPVHFDQQSADAKKWQIWVTVSKVGVYYEVHDTRGADGAEEMLGGFAGYVMCDGLKSYTSLAAKYPSIRLLQCWVHCRRGFVECEQAFPNECGEVLELIGKLYKIEAGARDGPDADRLRLRQTESKQVTVEIMEWATRTIRDGPALPGTTLRDAIDYMLRRWKNLTFFLDDPTLPLDNNAAERALRGPVVGRKNHYGSRSLRGTVVAAILYSLLETAKLVGIDPHRYVEAAVAASMEGREVPLPHELVDTFAASPAAA